MTSSTPEGQPVLQTLAPALRELERQVRAWLASNRRFPLKPPARLEIENLAEDLNRQAASLQTDHPYLVIVLMGGTGVGKSTLLNALAGGAIAQASFQRPTTRDPVVYYHYSTQPHRLDPALQHCKLVSHDRPTLEFKVLVDTPDLDSNDTGNRDKLLRILPVADVVLFVGSQEKYHDKLGWDLFLNQRHRRAFAFVLNKWDRCVVPGASGVRPDEDLLRDLQKAGFEHPVLFRTCAQHWVDNAWLQRNGEPPPAPLEGEQFSELVHWLGEGLNRLEVEAIKARGVGQLLLQLQSALESAAPPDLTDAAQRVQERWKMILDEEALAQAGFLLNSLEPHQREIEHHFAVQRQSKFNGLMGVYLQFFNKLRYSGSWRSQIPVIGNGASSAPPPLDLNMLGRASSATSNQQHFASRQKALAARLLAEADPLGFPLTYIEETTEETARLDWRPRLDNAVVEVIAQVEHSWSHPAGIRKGIQTAVILIADWLPLLGFGAMGVLLIWQYTMEQRPFALGDLLLPAIVCVLVMAVLHVVVSIVMPLRWQSIRASFEGVLRRRIRAELDGAFQAIPAKKSQEFLAERRQVEKILVETSELAKWLLRHEKEARIGALYGSPEEVPARRSGE